MIQRRNVVGVIGAVALSSAFFFPLTSSAAPAPSDEAVPVKGTRSQPVRIIVPFPAGGPLDVAARAIAEAAAPELGVVIVENRPGAGGAVGMNHAKRGRGDGRTIVVGAVATHAINPHLFKNLSYDPLKDFKPVTLIADVPNVLVVTPAFAEKHGVRNVRDLVAYAKAHPGELNAATGGNGSGGHMSLELLRLKTGASMVHVPYAGAAAARLSVLSGQTDLIFDNLASAVASIDAGDLVPLAVTTKSRSPMLPDVPTLAEAGVPGFDISTWFGLFVPASTPDATVEALNREFTAVLRSEALKKRLEKLGAMVSPDSSVQFGKLIRSEYDRYGELVRLSGARVD